MSSTTCGVSKEVQKANVDIQFFVVLLLVRGEIDIFEISLHHASSPLRNPLPAIALLP